MFKFIMRAIWILNFIYFIYLYVSSIPKYLTIIQKRFSLIILNNGLTQSVWKNTKEKIFLVLEKGFYTNELYQGIWTLYSNER